VLLLLEIARCPVVSQCLANPGLAHGCSAIVRSQRSESLAEHRVPEPWSGHLATAPILFIGSNPSISANESPNAPDPRWRDSDEYITDYFENRFDRHITAREYASVKFWQAVQDLATELLENPAIPGRDFALTEVVHCKSTAEGGVAQAMGECARRYLGRVIEASGAHIVVVLGAKAREATQATFDLHQMTGTLHLVDVGTRPRLVIFLPHPSAYIPALEKTFRHQLSAADLETARALLRTPAQTASFTPSVLPPPRSTSNLPTPMATSVGATPHIGSELLVNRGTSREFLAELGNRAARAGWTRHRDKVPDHKDASWYITAGAGKSRLFYSFKVWDTQRLGIELWISNDKEKSVYSALRSNKAAIEASFGDFLAWDRRDGEATSTLQFSLPEIPFSPNRSEWPTVQDQLAAVMIRFDRALQPYIQQLRRS